MARGRRESGGSKRGSLLGNSAALLAARFFAILAGGALSLYAIRTLSVEQYGEYAIALTMVTLFGLISEFGIATVAVRRMIEESHDTPRALGVALGAEIATSLAAAVLVVPAGLVLGYPAPIIGLLAIGSLLVLVQGVLAGLESPFQARRALNYVAAFAALQAGVTAVVGIAALAAEGGPRALILALIAGNLSAVPASLYFLRARLGVWPRFRGTAREVWPTLRLGLPIAATGGLAIVYERVDLIMVSKLDGTSGAATYNIALTVLTLSQVVPAVVTTSLFPLLSEDLRTDPGRARESYLRVFRGFVLISLPPILFLAVSAHRLVPLVFGDRYDDAALPVAIMGASIVLGFLNYLLWYTLLAAHRERRKVGIMVAALAINVALNAALIPKFGPSGAAAALVVSDVLVVGFQLGLVRRQIFDDVPILSLVLWPAVAALLGAGAGVVLIGLSWVAAAVAASSVAAGALVVSGYVRRSEWTALTGATRAASN